MTEQQTAATDNALEPVAWMYEQDGKQPLITTFRINLADFGMEGRTETALYRAMPSYADNPNAADWEAAAHEIADSELDLKIQLESSGKETARLEELVRVYRQAQLTAEFKLQREQDNAKGWQGRAEFLEKETATAEADRQRMREALEKIADLNVSLNFELGQALNPASKEVNDANR